VLTTSVCTFVAADSYRVFRYIYISVVSNIRQTPSLRASFVGHAAIIPFDRTKKSSRTIYNVFVSSDRLRPICVVWLRSKYLKRPIRCTDLNRIRSPSIYVFKRNQTRNDFTNSKSASSRNKFILVAGVRSARMVGE